MYFITEFGCIHAGGRDYLLTRVRAALGAGVDAVKFQVFTADEVVNPNYLRSSEACGTVLCTDTSRFD